MSNPTLIIAIKEITEAVRDLRSLTSSLLYALMGPVIVGLLTATRSSEATEPMTLLALSSLFLLLSTFTGGMNIAMDTLAGERERRSLLPLVMNPVTKIQLIAGKWISVGTFSVFALFLNLIAFAGIIGHVLPGRFSDFVRPTVIACLLLAMIPLAMLAAAAELAVSTICRSVKEAHTWLAFLVFVPVAFGMFLAFHPNVFGEWSYAVPVLGQQVLLSSLAEGKIVGLSQALILCIVSLVGTLTLLRATSKILQRDGVLYGS